MLNQIAKVTWNNDGVPVSDRYDDPYFSLENGLEETRHVFLQGNNLPDRLCDGFHVAELGFGTGLNFLTTLLSWRKAGGTGCIYFTSFEAFPMAAADMSKALGRFPEFADVADELTGAWRPEGGAFRISQAMQLDVIVGDARDTLPRWKGRADAWFLDGFSPAKNPELWSEEVLHQVAAHTASRGTFATYTAAGHVRRTLSDAGFDVERINGFGRKRHMSVGKLRS